MTRRSGRGSQYHGEFTPAEGSFEFTGENDNNTTGRKPHDPRMVRAARAFLNRVGS